MLNNKLKLAALSAAMMALVACGSDSDDTAEKEGSTACAAETLTWTDANGNFSCTVDIAAGEEGDIRSVLDTTYVDGSQLGSATYQCAGNQWMEEAGATCITGLYLNLKAADTTRYTETVTGAYAEIGKTYNGSDELDGFFAIADDTERGTGVDAFPFEGDWDQSVLVELNLTTLDATASGTVDVVALTADFNQFMPAEVTSIGVPFTTALDVTGGKVDFVGGAPDAISEAITADVTFAIEHPQYGNIQFVGTLELYQEDRAFLFTLLVDQDLTIPGQGEINFTWDATGAFRPTP